MSRVAQAEAVARERGELVEGSHRRASCWMGPEGSRGGGGAGPAPGDGGGARRNVSDGGGVGVRGRAADPAEEEDASGAALERLERSEDSSSSKRERPREERMPGSVFIKARRHLGGEGGTGRGSIRAWGC